MKNTNGLVAVLFLIAATSIAGCRNPMTRSGTATASSDEAKKTADREVQLVSATETRAITFLDSDALRYGTGPMDQNASTEFLTTASGLRYRVLRESRGRKPTSRSSVTVNYRGWLDSGKEFDSSYDRGQPISFPLNGVIPGWTEGMQLIGEGGMIELWIPARLGYGAQGSGGSVPPNATLHFIVELIKVQ